MALVVEGTWTVGAILTGAITVGVHGYEVRKSVPTGSEGPQDLKAWVDRDPTVASLENAVIAGKATVVTAPGYADVLRLGGHSS